VFENDNCHSAVRRHYTSRGTESWEGTPKEERLNANLERQTKA